MRTFYWSQHYRISCIFVFPTQRGCYMQWFFYIVIVNSIGAMRTYTRFTDRCIAEFYALLLFTLLLFLLLLFLLLLFLSIRYLQHLFNNIHNFFTHIIWNTKQSLKKHIKGVLVLCNGRAIRDTSISHPHRASSQA